MLSFLRWFDGEQQDDNGHEPAGVENNPTLFSSTRETGPRSSSAPLQSLSLIGTSNLVVQREIPVQSKGPSNVTTAPAEEYVTNYFGKMVPGRNSIMFDTKTHRQIISILLGHAKSLSKGMYVNKSGSCSCTLVGAKGIGKTECFLNFMHLANQIVANVIVVYVDFSGVGIGESILRNESLSATLCRELTKYGVQVVASDPENPLPLVYRLLEALQLTGLRLLLLVDELDQLYRCNLQPDTLISTLGELCVIGTQRTGSISVVLCGSSAMMENLISANATPLAREEFRLLEWGVPNLNCTKYRTKRVYSVTPVDLEALASVLQMECSNDRRPYLRLVAYRTGCNPRRVDHLLDETEDSGSSAHSPLAPEFSTGNNTLFNPDLGRLREFVLKLLWDANRSLLNDIFGGDGDKSEADIVQAICTTPWETRLLPVKFAAVEEAWKKDTKGAEELQDFRFVLFGVLHLVDRCWLAIDGVENSAPNFIYPCSLESLIATSASEAKRQSIWRQSQEALHGMAAVSGAFLGNPTVARVAGATVGATIPSLCLIT